MWPCKVHVFFELCFLLLLSSLVLICFSPSWDYTGVSQTTRQELWVRHLYHTGERLHETHINKLSLAHSEVWSTARVSEVSAGKAGSHWFMEYLEMEGLHFSFKGRRSLVWGGLCWEKILGNFLLILQITHRDEGCFCFPKTDLKRKYCLKLVSASARASAKRCEQQ